MKVAVVTFIEIPDAVVIEVPREKVRETARLVHERLASSGNVVKLVPEDLAAWLEKELS